MSRSFGDPARRVVRFGSFELDLHTKELRKQGVRLKLRGIPVDVLAALVERPGDLVTRTELRQRLWPDDTFVDYENSMNSAVARVREALGDSADQPTYIETLPKRGYRFIAPVEVGEFSVLIEETKKGSGLFFSATGARDLTAAAQAEPGLGVDGRGVSHEAGTDANLSAEIIRPDPFSVSAASAQVVALSRSRAPWQWAVASLIVIAGAVVLARPMFERWQLARESRDAMRLGDQQMRAGSAEAAVRFYQEAIRSDPRNALAHGAMAHALHRLGDGAAFVRPRGQSPSVLSAQRAVAIDPTCGLCHGSLGFFLFYHDWRWRDAESHLREGLRLAPESESILPPYAMLLSVTGRAAQARELMDVALARQPYQISWLGIRASTLYFERRYDEAIGAADKLLAITPNDRMGWTWRAAALFQTGRGEEAVRAIGHAILSAERNQLDQALAAGGVRQGLQKLLDLTNPEPSRTNFTWRRAAWLLMLDDEEGAFGELESAVQNRNQNVIYIAADPVYDVLRSHPRFVELLRELDLAAPPAPPVS